METELVTDKDLTTARVKLSCEQTIYDITRFVEGTKQLAPNGVCTLQKDGVTYNGRSIFSLLSANLQPDDVVEISATGDKTRMEYLVSCLRTPLTEDPHLIQLQRSRGAQRPYTTVDQLVVTNK